VRDDTRRALCQRLSRFDHLVEVGIGHRPAVARSLADAGVEVIATDVDERSVPDGVAFVVDDVTDPDLSVYADADAIYALNCPPELHRPIRDLARRLGVPFLFTTLGRDPPDVPVERETVPGETLFRSRYEPGESSPH
jgi:uncharacterized UPF0146 family protein